MPQHSHEHLPRKTSGNRDAIAALVFALLLGLPVMATAQNMSNSVVNDAMVFGHGKSDAEASGRASYAMSYVYTLKLRRGQTVSAKLKSHTDAVTFSLIAPQAGTVDTAFGVTQWSGVMAESGTCRIVLVMNHRALEPVPYRLTVAVH